MFKSVRLPERPCITMITFMFERSRYQSIHAQTIIALMLESIPVPELHAQTTITFVFQAHQGTKSTALSVTNSLSYTDFERRKMADSQSSVALTAAISTCKTQQMGYLHAKTQRPVGRTACHVQPCQDGKAQNAELFRLLGFGFRVSFRASSNPFHGHLVLGIFLNIRAADS